MEYGELKCAELAIGPIDLVSIIDARLAAESIASDVDGYGSGSIYDAFAIGWHAALDDVRAVIAAHEGILDRYTEKLASNLDLAEWRGERLGVAMVFCKGWTSGRESHEDHLRWGWRRGMELCVHEFAERRVIGRPQATLVWQQRNHRIAHHHYQCLDGGYHIWYEDGHVTREVTERPECTRCRLSLWGNSNHNGINVYQVSKEEWDTYVRGVEGGTESLMAERRVRFVNDSALRVEVTDV